MRTGQAQWNDLVDALFAMDAEDPFLSQTVDPPESDAALALKGNPNHDPRTGEFSSLHVVIEHTKEGIIQHGKPLSKKKAHAKGMQLRRAGHSEVYVFPKDSPWNPLAHALKFNPHHDPKSGEFSSGGIAGALLDPNPHSTYHEWGNRRRLPQGTGFKNTPHLEGPIPESMKPALPMDRKPKSQSPLATQDVESVGKSFEGGTNQTLLVTLKDGTKAIYKPESGERWGAGFTNSDIDNYITNTKFSLAEREETAYDVDQQLGLGLVPETVLRHNVDIDVPAKEQDWDEDDVRQRYDSYRERAQEDAMDVAGREMGEMYRDAADEHLKDIQNRAEEMNDIWNEAIKDYPDEAAGSPSMLRQHPNLPLGSQAFERKPAKSVLDPIKVLDEAGVEVDGAFNDKEKAKVEAVLRKHLDAGYNTLGDVDEENAKSHLDYGEWVEGHEDTENKIIEKNIKSYTDWRQEQGYHSNQSEGGSDHASNDEAPHPNGGSLQQFIRGDDYGETSPDEESKFAILDYVLGSMDRHAHNVMHGMFQDQAGTKAIDNGYSMPGGMGTPDGFRFRSSPVRNWQAGGLIDDQLRTTTLAKLKATDWETFVKTQHASMSEDESTAFLGRIKNMETALSTPMGLKDLWKKQQVMG